MFSFKQYFQQRCFLMKNVKVFNFNNALQQNSTRVRRRRHVYFQLIVGYFLVRYRNG